jgi:hypothetical protein
MQLHLMPADQDQLSLSAAPTAASEQRERLLEVMDRINREMGRDTPWIAAQALTHQEREASWRMQRGTLSPAYTTRWADVATGYGQVMQGALSRGNCAGVPRWC